MLIFFLFLSAVLITLFAEWIIKPELIESLVRNFPSYDWSHFAILVLIFNYFILALSLYIAPKVKANNDLNLPIGGLIAASSIGSLLSLSFNFNMLWNAITPKYLTLIILTIYVFNFFLPLSVFSIKQNESSDQSDEFKKIKFVSNLRKLLAQTEISMIQSNFALEEFNLLCKKIEIEKINDQDFIELLDKLSILIKDLPNYNEIAIHINVLKNELHVS